MFPMDKLENAFIFCSSKLPKPHHLGKEGGLVSLLRVFSCSCLLWENPPPSKQAQGVRVRNAFFKMPHRCSHSVAFEGLCSNRSLFHFPDLQL